MPVPSAHHDLIAVLMPQGVPQLEWAPAGIRIDKSRHLLQEELFRRFKSGDATWLLALGFADEGVRLSPSLSFWRDVASHFTRRLIRTPDLETLRDALRLDLAADTTATWLAAAPLMTGLEYLDTDRLRTVWEYLERGWQRAVKRHPGNVADLVRTFRPSAHLVGRIYFHLVENKDAQLPFAFLATYSTRLNQAGESKHVPLKFALQEFAGHPEQLLALMTTVHDAARSSRLAGELLDNGTIFQPLAWTANQAYRFLKDIPVFENAGIMCRIPNWWKTGSPRISLNLQWLGELMQKLNKPANLGDVRPGKHFKARLRDYQRIGLNWLALLRQMHLGACLADDMGLGKTVQVLGLLSTIYGPSKNGDGGRQPSLLVIPASLLANWTAEIEHFSPF